MHLRWYRSADFNALYELDRACFSARFRFSRAMMRRVVQAPRALVLLACDMDNAGAERIIGFCAVETMGEGSEAWTYISTLDVSPENRGRGIGRLLVEGVEAEAGKWGARAMLLHVYVENASALRPYERLGYEAIGREPAFYGQDLDALLYRRWLRTVQ